MYDCRDDREWHLYFIGSLQMLDISVSPRVTIKISGSILGWLDTGRNGSRFIIWAAILGWMFRTLGEYHLSL